MRVLNEESFDESVKDGLVLVDFFSKSCGPCKMVMPIVEQLEQENQTVSFYKVDVEDSQALATKYSVRGLPLFVLYKDGKEVSRKTGAMPKATLQQFINSFNKE